jgi:hypothetical protein
VADSCDIQAGTSIDGNTDGLPDECQGLIEAHSVRTHGAFGECALLVHQAGGSPSNVEPRLGGVLKLRVTFEIEMDPATATDQGNVSIVGVDSGAYAGPLTVSLDGTDKVVTIELGQGLSDGDCYTVDLTGMLSQRGVAPLARTFTVATVAGDANRNGAVSSSDYAGAKQRLGSVVTGTNCQYDVNHDGAISSADGASIKPRLGKVGTSCP